MLVVRPLVITVVVLFSTLATLTAPAHGADRLWWGTFSNSFNFNGNWAGVVLPETTDTALFTGDSTAVLRTDVRLDQNTTVAGFRIIDRVFGAPYSFTKVGGSVLNVTGNTTFTHGLTPTRPVNNITFDGFNLRTVTLTLDEKAELTMQNGATLYTSGALSMNKSAVINLNSGELRLAANESHRMPAARSPWGPIRSWMSGALTPASTSPADLTFMIWWSCGCRAALKSAAKVTSTSAMAALAN